jgi:predicted N-acyltransferase
MEIRTISSLTEVDAKDWNQLTPEDYPFLTHEFLTSLETYDCLEPNGWQTLFLLLEEDGQLLGAMPTYLKTNSIGEFVFDWSWADAYERAGGRYYPKLVCAIPFVPSTGPRILLAPGTEDTLQMQTVLAKGAVAIAEQLEVSSLHCLFPPDEEMPQLTDAGMLARFGCQYHWHNNEYTNFDDFLACLTSKKRKQIRRERREVESAGIEVEVLHGDEISPEQWRTFYDFYCSTFYRRWGDPRFTLEFFQGLSERLPRQTLLFLARHGEEYVAGAFALRGNETLYGRHWGCSQHFKHLHFELCYYQTIEYCITHGLKRVDAGAQGEHKIARGFVPVRTCSAHWIRDDGFRKAIAEFLERETNMIEHQIDVLDKHSPYKQVV